MQVHEFARNLGTFDFAITEAINSEAAGGDPCHGGGAQMTEDNAIISFQPDGNYAGAPPT